MTRRHSSGVQMPQPARMTEAQWRGQVGVLEAEVRRLEAVVMQGDRLHDRELQRQGEHVGVLLSDRDRLTAALEVATRRLASPAADKDPARAGWRANSLEYQNQRSAQTLEKERG